MDASTSPVAPRWVFRWAEPQAPYEDETVELPLIPEPAWWSASANDELPAEDEQLAGRKHAQSLNLNGAAWSRHGFSNMSVKHRGAARDLS